MYGPYTVVYLLLFSWGEFPGPKGDVDPRGDDVSKEDPPPTAKRTDQKPREKKQKTKKQKDPK